MYICRGARGWFGAGIYFADSPKEAKYKAKQGSIGAMVVAFVELGQQKLLTDPRTAQTQAISHSGLKV